MGVRGDLTMANKFWDMDEKTIVPVNKEKKKKPTKKKKTTAKKIKKKPGKNG